MIKPNLVQMIDRTSIQIIKNNLINTTHITNKTIQGVSS